MEWAQDKLRAEKQAHTLEVVKDLTISASLEKSEAENKKLKVAQDAKDYTRKVKSVSSDYLEGCL